MDKKRKKRGGGGEREKEAALRCSPYCPASSRGSAREALPTLQEERKRRGRREMFCGVFLFSPYLSVEGKGRGYM